MATPSGCGHFLLSHYVKTRRNSYLHHLERLVLASTKIFPQMNPTLKSILAIIVGWIVGSVVNMGLINVGMAIFPLKGVDASDLEAMATALANAKPIQFLFPFLAHALGTLSGAFVAALIAPSHKMRYAFVIGGLFLLGGIAVNYMIPGPAWFTALDILLAYLPMAWLGGKIAAAFQGTKAL